MEKVATAVKLSNEWLLAIVGGTCSSISALEFENLVGSTYFIIDPLADRAVVAKTQRLRARHNAEVGFFIFLIAHL